jgi:hypothetical protein
MAYNHECGYGQVFGANHKYTAEKLISKCNVINMENSSYTSSNNLYEFSEMIFDNISTIGIAKSANKVSDINIEREPETELRSVMLENIGIKACDLIKKGYKPSDITLISTFADPVTEYVIGRILENNGISLKNISRKSRFLDNQFTQSLVTLGYLCHPDNNAIPNRDDVKALVQLVLKIDPIRSSILAGEICSQRPFAKFPDLEDQELVERIGYRNLEKYKHIQGWIDEYTNSEPLPINIFFQRVFLEILLSNEISQEDILQCKKLIDSSKTFVDIIPKFMKKDANKAFLQTIKSGIKSAESIFELEENLGGNHVILTTPLNYLANDLNSKVVILLGISSKNWTPRNIREMSNPYVLTNTWSEDLIYTEDMEFENQKHNIALVLRAVIKRCKEKLITFVSTFSANGYENDGIIGDFFDILMEGQNGENHGA